MKSHIWYTVDILPNQASNFSQEKPSYGEFITIRNFHNEPRKEAVEYARSLFKVINPFPKNPNILWDARVFVCTWSRPKTIGKGFFRRYEEVGK